MSFIFDDFSEFRTDVRELIQEYLKENLSIHISTETDWDSNAGAYLIKKIDVSVKLNGEEITSNYTSP